jgi:hypothetical protein
VYTIWRGDMLLYVGMSGWGAHAEDLVAIPALDDTYKTKWLWTRLDSDASGRRSGDQFNVYVCDRFIIPALTTSQQRDIAVGKLLLDQLTGQGPGGAERPIWRNFLVHGASTLPGKPGAAPGLTAAVLGWEA